MEILKALKDKLICVDTAPFIYFIENHRRYSKFLSEFFSYNERDILVQRP